jgi:uncharacterized protein involved in exopolysaccharide biosynthesis
MTQAGLAGGADWRAHTRATGWAQRPKLSVGDLIILLWREKWWMLGVGAAITTLGIVVALQLPQSFEATSRLLVRAGQEYVYQPRVGEAARAGGDVPPVDQYVQSEVEILRSPVLGERVLRRIGLERLYPEMAKKVADAAPGEKPKYFGRALLVFQKSFSVASAPRNAVIRATFKHKDPALAATVVNALIDDYLLYRRDILAPGDSVALESQREDFELRLKTAESDLQDFYRQNTIGDFEAERAAVSKAYSDVTQALIETQAERRRADQRIAVMDAEARTVPAEVRLHYDSDASQRLLTLRAEREDLLSRYRPEAQPVQEIDRRIQQFEAWIAQGGPGEDGVVRRGANPVYQSLETDRIRAEAEAVALRAREAELKRQRDALQQNQLRLQALAPSFNALTREREVLASNVRDFAQREEQARALRALAEKEVDNISILERAAPPPRGVNLRMPVAIIGAAFAAFSALMVGLLRALTRRGFPSPASAGRTLDLPVLGAAQRYG